MIFRIEKIFFTLSVWFNMKIDSTLYLYYIYSVSYSVWYLYLCCFHHQLLLLLLFHKLFRLVCLSFLFWSLNIVIISKTGITIFVVFITKYCFYFTNCLDWYLYLCCFASQILSLMHKLFWLDSTFYCFLVLFFISVVLFQGDTTMTQLFIETGVWEILWHRMAQALQVVCPQQSKPIHDLETSLEGGVFQKPDWTLISPQGVVAALQMSVNVFTKVTSQKCITCTPDKFFNESRILIFCRIFSHRFFSLGCCFLLHLVSIFFKLKETECSSFRWFPGFWMQFLASSKVATVFSFKFL